jgi:hypothetical protein
MVSIPSSDDARSQEGYYTPDDEFEDAVEDDEQRHEREEVFGETVSSVGQQTHDPLRLTMPVGSSFAFVPPTPGTVDKSQSAAKGPRQRITLSPSEEVSFFNVAESTRFEGFKTGKKGKKSVFGVNDAPVEEREREEEEKELELKKSDQLALEREELTAKLAELNAEMDEAIKRKNAAEQALAYAEERCVEITSL